MSKLIKLTNPEEVPELIKEAICYYRGCYPQYSDAEIARRVNKNLDCISIDEKLVLEILELALSTSFDHNKLQQKFENHSKVLKTYQNLAYNLASSLKAIFKSIENHKKYVPKHSLLKDLESLENAINEYQSDLGKEQASEGVWMLSNMLHYAEKQIEKIKIIERAFMPNFNSNEFKI